MFTWEALNLAEIPVAGFSLINFIQTATQWGFKNQFPREVAWNHRKPRGENVVRRLALVPGQWGLCCVVLMQRAVTFSHCCDSVPLPLCRCHCRDWHQAERCGKYYSHVASVCQPQPRPGLSCDAMHEPQTVGCVAEVAAVSLCVLCVLIDAVFEL